MNYLIITKNKRILKNLWVVIENVNFKNKIILKSLKNKRDKTKTHHLKKNPKVPQKTKQNIKITYVNAILLAKEGITCSF